MLPSLGFLLNSQCLEPGRQVWHISGRGVDVSPLNHAGAVDGKSAAGLPPAPALCRPVPYALSLAEAEDGVEDAGVSHVPEAGDAETPLGVEVAGLVDHDVNVPVAADLGDPALGSFGRGVGDSDAVQVGVVGRDCG